MIVHTDWLLTPERAAIHEPSATAVIADLHLGYDEARRRRGEAIPCARLDDVLAALQSLLIAHPVRRLVIAGDLFEAGFCRASTAELIRFLHLAGVELAGIVPGNHDRDIQEESIRQAVCPNGILLDRWRVVHGDRPLPRGPVIHGHLHPCFRWAGRQSAPCYLVGPQRIILPAFSLDAAGVNVLRQRRCRDFRCCVIAGNKVLDFGPVAKLRGVLGAEWS